MKYKRLLDNTFEEYINEVFGDDLNPPSPDDYEFNYYDSSDNQREAQRELSKLRDTFAKHDIGKLALAKPKLIENIVNKGTKKVKDDMIELTKPEQYD